MPFILHVFGLLCIFVGRLPFSMVYNEIQKVGGTRSPPCIQGQNLGRFCLLLALSGRPWSVLNIYLVAFNLRKILLEILDAVVAVVLSLGGIA